MTAVETLPDRGAWLEWRRHGIGASDIASAVTGLYGGRVGVVADKLGYGAKDIAPGLAERGERWEQPIADMVLGATGLYVHGEQMQAEHPDRPDHRCTIDGFLDHRTEVRVDEIDTLLEDKTSSVFTKPKWAYYETQTQWQMWVTGMSRALIAVARINDSEPDEGRQLAGLELRWVDRDEFTIGQLIEEADYLLDCVAKNRIPEPSDGTTLDVIRRANAKASPEANETVGPALDDIEDLIAGYDDLKAAVKQAEDDLRLHESRIRVAMGEATEGFTTDGRWRVRVGEPATKFTRDSEADALDEYPDYSKTSLDRARFKAEQPDAYTRLKRPSTDRRLTIKEYT